MLQSGPQMARFEYNLRAAGWTKLKTWIMGPPVLNDMVELRRHEGSGDCILSFRGSDTPADFISDFSTDTVEYMGLGQLGQGIVREFDELLQVSRSLRRFSPPRCSYFCFLSLQAYVLVLSYPPSRSRMPPLQTHPLRPCAGRRRSPHRRLTLALVAYPSELMTEARLGRATAWTFSSATARYASATLSHVAA